jgi:hypothetical protein
MIVGIVWLISHFNSKKRREINETIRLAISQGQTLSPETLDKLMRASDPVRNDLRRGVLLLAVGGAIGASALLAGAWYDQGAREGLFFAILPVTLGLAYLGLWAGGRGKQS